MYFEQKVRKLFDANGILPAFLDEFLDTLDNMLVIFNWSDCSFCNWCHFCFRYRWFDFIQSRKLRKKTIQICNTLWCFNFMVNNHNRRDVFLIQWFKTYLLVEKLYSLHFALVFCTALELYLISLSIYIYYSYILGFSGSLLTPLKER